MQMEKGREKGGSKRDSLLDYATSAREDGTKFDRREREREGGGGLGHISSGSFDPFPNQSLDRMARDRRMTMVDEGMAMRYEEYCRGRGSSLHFEPVVITSKSGWFLHGKAVNWERLVFSFSYSSSLEPSSRPFLHCDLSHSIQYSIGS